MNGRGGIVTVIVRLDGDSGTGDAAGLVEPLEIGRRTAIELDAQAPGRGP